MTDWGNYGRAASSAYTTYMSSKSQRLQGRMEQKWWQYNAALKEIEAKKEQQAGEYAAKLHRKAGAGFLESQRASYAAAGVGEEGTPAIVAQKSAEEIEIDALSIERAGMDRAMAARGRAGLDRFRGKMARGMGRTRATRTLLTGASDIWNTYG